MNQQVLGNLDNIITALKTTPTQRSLQMAADNSRHIIAAARQRRELTRAKAIQALRTLDNDGATVAFQTVAQAADMSRSWLYAQPDIRAEIERGKSVPTLLARST